MSKNANPSTALTVSLSQGLNIFCARVVKHPTNSTRTRSGKQLPVKNFLVVVYGHLNPNNPQQVLIWDKDTQPLVGFFAGLESTIVKSGATKDTTLYIPATGISAEATKKRVTDAEGNVSYEDLTTGDGTPIHAFDGLALEKIEVVTERKAAFQPKIAEARESKALSGEGIEENARKMGILGRLASLMSSNG